MVFGMFLRNGAKEKMARCTVCAMFFALMAFCICSCNDEKNETFKIVFYPNESGESMKDARAAFQEVLQKALEREVEVLTTTDYNIALETLISGKANMAYVGAEGYIQAHNKNAAVIPLVTNSGPSGTLEDSLYYSFVACSTKHVGEFVGESGGFDVETVRGKKVSFVSPNSTSGFTIPAKFLQKKLGAENTDELIAEGAFLGKTIFASSHQGSQVMLFTEEADIACFAIPQTIKVYALAEGEANADGAVYEVQPCDDKPFSDYVGEKITILKSLPVLNAPLVINSATVTSEEVQKIRAMLTSDETTNNPGIFRQEGSTIKGIFPRWSEATRLIEVDDSWYDKLRDAQ